MFSNFKIRTKIGVLAFVMMIFILLIGGVGYRNITESNEDLTSMYNNRLIAIELLNDSRAQQRAVEADLYSIILNIDNPQEQQVKVKDIQERAKVFNDNFEKYKSLDLFQFELDIIPTLEKNLGQYREGREKVIALGMSGKEKEALEAYRSIEKVAEEFQQNLIDLSKFNVKAAEDLSIESDVEYDNAMKIFIGIFVIALVFSIGVTYFISKAISIPMALAINHMQEVSEYNISKDVPPVFMNRKDEIGDLGRAIQKIEENLRGLLKSIGNTSEQVAASAEELTTTSQQSAAAAEEVAKTIEQISRGATDQAQSTTEGSEKLMELGNLIEEDKRHVEILNESSNKVNELVRQGIDILDKLSIKTKENGDAAGSVYESIKKTNESSGKISEASNLIASIAKQTNLLALNAAIEAARAGEHGKGFAVVADEIRKLAEQSTESTKIIDNMVKALQQDSEKAVEIMEGVEVIIKEQMESMNFTENKFKEMNEAMKESKQAVEILNQAKKQMTEKKDEVLDTIQTLSAVAEENAAGTEEASASMEEQTASMEEITSASEGLSKLSQELQALIEKFKI